jgi:hypothetical protein
MFAVAERFLLDIAEGYGGYPVSTDDGDMVSQVYQFLKLKYYLHSSH